MTSDRTAGPGVCSNRPHEAGRILKKSLMQLDFEDLRPDTPRLPPALSRLEQALLALVLYLIIIVIYLVVPDSFWQAHLVQQPPPAMDEPMRFVRIEPNMDRLLPPAPELPLPAPPTLSTAAEGVDRLFMHALGRAPSLAERRVAIAAVANPANGGRPSADGLADLLWALLMKPEFQLIY